MNIKIKILKEACAAMDHEPEPQDIRGMRPQKLPNAHQGEEGRMYRTQLAQMISDTKMLLDLFDDKDDLPEWLEVKITKAADYISSAARYLAGEAAREKGIL